MIWYTSDLHFGHRFVAGIRGYDNVDEHDQAIINHWDRTVKKDDIVYVLGDLAVSNPTRAIELVAARPGRKRLIAGNHDYGHPMYRDNHRWLPKYNTAFESVQPFGHRRIGGRSVLLSHFPYKDDRDENPRFMQYRLPDLGEFLLHGHLHEPFAYTSRTEMHVGWDAWNGFVSDNDVIRWWADEPVVE